MTVNEGKIDRIFRVIIGAALAGAGFFTAGWAAIILWVAGGILIITGITGFCGIYALFGIKTCPLEKD